MEVPNTSDRTAQSQCSTRTVAQTCKLYIVLGWVEHAQTQYAWTPSESLLNKKQKNTVL